jgi:hypothetical protein
MTMQDNFFNNQFWKDILGEFPEAGYAARLQQQTPQGSPQRRYFQPRYNPIFQEYLGEAGQQILGGGAPTLAFDDFLGNYDFNRRFRSRAPTERGQGQARFNTPTRFFF